MSKRTKTLIFTAVGVLLLCGALLVVMLIPPAVPPVDSSTPSQESSEGQNSNVIVLLDKTKDDKGDAVTVPVTGMVTETKDDKGNVNSVQLSLNKDGALHCPLYADLPANQTALSNVSQTLCYIKASKEIGVPENAADFGFDKPSIKVTATYHDGTTHSYEIGAMTPDEEGCYYRAVGSEEIYVVDTSYLVYPGMTPLAYISTTLMAAPVAEKNTETVTNTVVLRDMALSGSVRKTAFAFQMPALDDAQFANFTYKIVSPYLRGGNTLISQSLTYFTSLSAAVAAIAHPTAAEKKACGFEDPYSVAFLHTAVKRVEKTEASDASGESTTTQTFYNVQEHTITVGAKDESTGYYFVMVDDIDVIYFVDGASMSAWLALQYEELADSLLFSVHIKTVSSMQISRPGAEDVTYTLHHKTDVEEDEENLTVSYNGKAMPESANEDFRALYMLAMSLNRYSAAPESFSTDPADLVMRLRVTLEDETAPAVDASFYKLSGNLYLCRVKGGETYTVKLSTVRTFLERVDMYCNGQAFPDEIV